MSTPLMMTFALGLYVGICAGIVLAALVTIARGDEEHGDA